MRQQKQEENKIFKEKQKEALRFVLKIKKEKQQQEEFKDKLSKK